jgi:serine/threonine protein kinase
MKTGSCPQTAQFERFARGDLADAERHEVEEHLRECPPCRQLSAGLSPGGSSVTDPAGQTLVTVEIRSGEPPSADGPATPASAGAPTLPRKAKETAVAAAAPLSALKSGDQLDKYEILAVLGRGGMGVVFKARDTVLDRIVAIKTLGPLLANSAVARKRFIREGRSAAAVKDQHVVTVYGVEEHQGAPYIVLEYVEGRSLEDLLSRSAPLPVEEVVRLGSQIAEGLAAAHQKGLIHRDVKPANVLLEHGTGRVTITDFGLARAVDDASVSRQGEVCGTPHYMAPEQVRGEAIDHRADLFSLGSVLYYMCTGKLPFDADNSMAVLHRVCLDEPTPIPQRNPAVPAWLVGLINTLHAKNPNQRIQSAAEVKEALLARRGGASTTQVIRAPATPPAPAAAPAATLSVRTVVGILLGPVFLLSLPTFYLLTRHEDKPAKEQPVAEAKPSRPAPEAPARIEVKQPEAPPKKQAPAKLPEVAQPAPPRPAPNRPVAPAPAAALKGLVMVRTNDPASAEFFRRDGLLLHDLKTGQQVPLEQARHYLPLGEYALEASLPPGFKVSPRQLTVAADHTAYVTLTFLPPPVGPSGGGAGPFPPGGPLPPPPPPPGGPPPRGGRR